MQKQSPVPCFFTYPKTNSFFRWIDFLQRNGYDRNKMNTEVLVLKKCNTITILITVISSVIAVCAAVVAVVLFFQKKKKDEEELEHYLDCSIQ
jgi:disulfide bond formation protein DsbB